MLIWIVAHRLSYLMHCFHFQIVRYFEDLAAYCIVLYLVDWTKSAQREIFSAAPTTAIGKIQSMVPPMRKVNTSFWNMDFQNIVKFSSIPVTFSSVLPLCRGLSEHSQILWHTHNQDIPLDCTGIMGCRHLLLDLALLLEQVAPGKLVSLPR